MSIKWKWNIMENHRPYPDIRPHLNVTSCSHNVGSIKVLIRRVSINYIESYFLLFKYIGPFFLWYVGPIFQTKLASVILCKMLLR